LSDLVYPDSNSEDSMSRPECIVKPTIVGET
jgi:hypothetical protein